jgi:ATP synthase protein I
MLADVRKGIVFRVVGLQVIATAVVALLAWLVAGAAAAVSALLGGAACFVPNGLFALRLAVSARRPGGTDVATFFIGEFLKIGSTIAAIVLIAWVWQDVVWLALIVAIIAALKSYLIALFFRSADKRA